MAGVLVLAACSRPAPPSAPLSADASAAPSDAPASARSAQASPVAEGMARYDGYGDLRFGMDETAFDNAWVGKLKGEAGPDSSCFYKSSAAATAAGDLGFMFENGQFARYDVRSTKETAPGGGKVGMSEARIRALYGARIVVQPHVYVDGANYLRIAAPAGDGVLLFETDEHGEVTRWRVGVPPQVDYVEGCS
ncbi:MAG: lectin [Rhodanobacter sp.]